MHYNAQHTETVLLLFPGRQTSITSHGWRRGQNETHIAIMWAMCLACSTVQVSNKSHNTSAVMVSIFVFAVGFGRFFNKNRGSRSVSVFYFYGCLQTKYHTRQVAR